jgi:hypothetical protein
MCEWEPYIKDLDEECVFYRMGLCNRPTGEQYYGKLCPTKGRKPKDIEHKEVPNKPICQN